MKRLVHAILRVLDGAPRPQSRGAQAGQSLLEMAFIIPLLAIMIAGIVEIGWFANRYLTLLEVTRVGARAGTVLTGEFSPLSWNELASAHPVVHLRAYGLSEAEIPGESRNYRDCNLVTTNTGFYNFIACTMLNSFEPLRLAGRAPTSTANAVKVIRDRQGNVINTIPFPDDIVISVFATQAINNANPNTITLPSLATDPRQYQLAVALFSRTYNFEAIPATAGRFRPGPQVIVVGRYPKRANECNVYDDNGTRVVVPGQDPFDYIPNNARDAILVAGQPRFIELEGLDPNPDYTQQAEAQLGFVWTAQKLRTDLMNAGRPALCWGSDFDSADVEALINLPTFIDEDPPGVAPWNLRRAAIPSNGIVIVEMFWQHEPLLRFPFVEPIIAAFGDVNNIVISAWASFPVPAAEPNIIYGLP
jgi:hypothetical protein